MKHDKTSCKSGGVCLNNHLFFFRGFRGKKSLIPKEEMTAFNKMIQKLRYEADREKGDEAIRKEKLRQLLNPIDPKDPFFGSGYTEA